MSPGNNRDFLLDIWKEEDPNVSFLDCIQEREWEDGERQELRVAADAVD
jgi:hypothetical protein